MKSIDALKDRTKYIIDNASHVQQAFELGLRWKQLPEDIVVELNWGKSPFTSEYQEMWVVHHISADGEDWQPLYRKLRELGWERKSVNREGGSLTYWLSHTDEEFPKNYRYRELRLDIVISTCQQVKVGTKVVDVYETRCADWKVPAEDPVPIYEVLELPPPEEKALQPAEYTWTEEPTEIEVYDDMQQFGTKDENHE